MKAPDGTIDLIGSGLMLANTVAGMISLNLPTKYERKKRVGERQLKHRYKKTPVDVYVRANFNDCSEETQLELISYYRSVLDRN